MLFNSGLFLSFFTVLLVLYSFSPKVRIQNFILLIGSYLFYCWWDFRFLGLVMISTAVDFLAAGQIQKSDNKRIKKMWLLVSLGVNFGLLGFFKYFNFLAENVQSLLSLVGVEGAPWSLDLILPLGISFYTFQTVSYTIDVYRGRFKAIDNYLDFSLYVSFFPQLIAGPIERASNLLPQIQNKRLITTDMVRTGSWLVLWGLFKKTYVADNLAPYTYFVTQGELSPHGMDFWPFSLAFNIRFYCDFSGYSDMAIGLASIMGIKLSRNFNFPYFSTNPSMLWQRWHITLMSWLRDYIYKPIRELNPSQYMRSVAIVVTLLFTGLWHGAHWKFVAWGIVWGIAIIIYQLLRPSISRLVGETYWKKVFFGISGCILTMVIWNTINAFFVFNNVEDALYVMKSLFFGWTGSGRNGRDLFSVFYFSWPLILLEVYSWKKDDAIAFLKLPYMIKLASYILIIILLIGNGAVGENEFIYFQF